MRISLREYYRLNPGAAKGRCPTSVLLVASQKALERSVEMEDTTITMTDLICVIASLIDQVCSSCTLHPRRGPRPRPEYRDLLVHALTNETGIHLGILVILTADFGDEVESRWDGGFPEGGTSRT